MDVDTIIQLVLNRCGNRTGSSALNDAALLELGLIQTRLEESPEPPWFCISESSTAATTIGEPRLSVPPDFLLEEENCDLWLQNSEGDWNSLSDKIEYDTLRIKYQNADNGLPCQYALRGSYFYLGPTPDAIYNVRMSYYKKQTAPALGVTNNWTKYAPDLLIAELGVIMTGQYLSDFDKMSTFEKELARAQVRLMNKNVIREETNMKGQL